MRVLHCIWRMSIGGAEQQLVLLAGGLVRRGLDVHVVTVFPGGNDAPLAATAAATHRLSPLGKYDPSLVPQMIRLCHRIQPDVMQTWLTYMDILAGLSGDVLRIPRVLFEASTGAYYRPSVLNRARAYLGTRAAAIVANSNGGREYWQQLIGDDQRLRVIPNIVPLAEIDSTPRASEGIGDNEEILLYAGRFSAEKNLEQLIRALPAVMERRPVKAVFCGDGPMRPGIEQQARDLGIADRTLFLGFVPNVWSWMKRATVFVSVSVLEGSPNTVLEAIACGTPLVLSDIAAHREMLSEESARFVDPQSSESMATGILAALTDREGAQTRATHARAILAGLSAGEIAGRYDEVYQEVVARRRARRAR